MLRLVLVGLTFATAVAAQSPLVTTFLNNNAGSVGGGIYFDLNVTIPIAITGLDLNLTGTGSVEVYTLVGTRIGNQTNPAAWTLASSGTVTGAIAGAQSPVAITPFVLTPGSYGVALKAIGVNHHYTNGTGANQNYATTELALAAGEASNAAFVAPLFTPRVVNTRIHYSIAGSGTLATNTTLGVGCIRSFATVYESFATPAAFDLGSSSMTLLPSGGGYVGLQGLFPYIAPTAAATVIALGNDVEQTVNLATPFMHPGGSTSALTVCSNGFVSVATGNGVGSSPNVAGMLAFPQTAWGGWHDYFPLGGASGNVKFEEVGLMSIVTWDAVHDFGSATPNTWQIQFDRATGFVNFVWQTMSMMGGPHLVFYGPGGPNLDPGNTDLSAALAGPGFMTGDTDIRPLALAATTRPITGTNWQLNVTNVPAGGIIGVDVFGLSDPGFDDLFFLGMPGCPLRSSLDSVLNWFVAGSTHSYSLAIPNSPSLVNAHLYTTSAVFQLPPANAFGAITANGIDGRIGSF